MPTTSRTATATAAPTHEVEDELRAAGARVVAGVDEVGRGAWAGPLLVCAAVSGEGEPPLGLTDSKRLTPKRRRELAEQLRPWVADHAFGWSAPEEIDEVGMTEALHRAARRALDALAPRPDAVILDGRHDFIGRPWRVRTQVKGDLTCVSVAAAAILAKVHRDALMADLAADHPGYGFERAAGYPSPVHRATLADFGPTPHHRMSWSYLDGLPRWKHLRRIRPAPGGQIPLL